MNGYFSKRLSSVRIVRVLLVCLSVLTLLAVSGEVKAVHSLSKPESFTAQSCNDIYCQYLPVIKTPDPCQVGRTLLDPANDVALPYLDVTSLTTSVSGTSLIGVFNIRYVPASLTFNRVGIREGTVEYAWMIHVDVDGNWDTGYPYFPQRGTEVMLSAWYSVSNPDSPITSPIPNKVWTNTWVYDPDIGGWFFHSVGGLTVNTAANTMIVSGTIPGLNPNSRLLFETMDANPGGNVIKDLSQCSFSSSGSQQAAEQEQRPMFYRQLSPESPFEVISAPLQ